MTRQRVPKSAYLTVMGMYGDQGCSDLTIEVRDDQGLPVGGAEVKLYLEDGNLCASQRTDEQGHTILWQIPDQGYTVEAQEGMMAGRATVNLDHEVTVIIDIRSP